VRLALFIRHRLSGGLPEALAIPDLVHKNKQLADVLAEVHADLAWALLWLVVLHSAAALKHHFIDHDSTLRRMLAWRRA